MNKFQIASALSTVMVASSFAGPAQDLIGASPQKAIATLGQPINERSGSLAMVQHFRAPGTAVFKVESAKGKIYKVMVQAPVGSLTPTQFLKTVGVVPKGAGSKRRLPGTETDLWSWEGASTPNVSRIFLRSSGVEPYYEELLKAGLKPSTRVYTLILSGPGAPKGGGVDMGIG